VGSSKIAILASLKSPAGQHDFLLVAAAQIHDLPVQGRWHDAQVVDIILAIPASERRLNRRKSGIWLKSAKVMFGGIESKGTSPPAGRGSASQVRAGWHLMAGGCSPVTH
jgi:hypothetical protein